jgi:hypothetical protein
VDSLSHAQLFLRGEGSLVSIANVLAVPQLGMIRGEFDVTCTIRFPRLFLGTQSDAATFITSDITVESSPLSPTITVCCTYAPACLS